MNFLHTSINKTRCKLKCVCNSIDDWDWLFPKML